MQKKIKCEEIAKLSMQKDWEISHEHIVYLTPTTRFDIKVENTKEKMYLTHLYLEEETNTLQSSQEQSDEFAEMLLDKMGEQLSVRNLTSIVTVFSNKIANRIDGKERLEKIINVLQKQIEDKIE